MQKSCDAGFTANVTKYTVIALQVISRLHCLYLGDEIHHTGWNACSSCYDKPTVSRSRLIVPGLMSSRIYIIDVATDPRNPRIDTVRI